MWFELYTLIIIVWVRNCWRKNEIAICIREDLNWIDEKEFPKILSDQENNLPKSYPLFLINCGIVKISRKNLIKDNETSIKN